MRKLAPVPGSGSPARVVVLALSGHRLRSMAQVVTLHHLVTTERRQIGDNPDALIWTWGKFRGDVPLSIGVSFTDPALDDMFTALPDGVFPYSLPTPDGARTRACPRL